MQDGSLNRSAVALGTYFVGDSSVAEALSNICQAAVDAVEPATMAGISMTVDARVGTYVCTHPEVQHIDQAQYNTGDGPCVDAFRTGQAVVVADTRNSERYGTFCRAAAQHGLRSVASVPMNTAASPVGALNVYSPADHAFGPDTVATVSSFATYGAYVLLNHQVYWDAHSLSENLQQAMTSRAEIEQAKGVIMASTGCTTDEAFAQLRAQSQHENVTLMPDNKPTAKPDDPKAGQPAPDAAAKLREIAAEIVRRAQTRRPK